MDSGLLAVVLLALAAALIIAEIFVPSAGLLAVGMLTSLLAAFYFAWLAWWPDQSAYFLSFILFALILLPATAVAALALLPYTPFGNQILLQPPQSTEVVPFAREEARLRQYLGQQARTLSPLCPSGLIVVNRERVHACSEGPVIDRDTVVEIIKVTGTRVVVRRMDPASIPPSAPEKLAATKAEPEVDPVSDDFIASDSEKSPQKNSPFDFDLSG